ncbi:nucleolar MIF4G domain-containing protein 1 homolog [Centruroides vittatus]|uniref:nucleolar MIF4G domain-containing protein 1 homolog n=1 Tax=Centruroides vittatus TaxID=120091 RepID=UPI00350F3DC1
MARGFNRRKNQTRKERRKNERIAKKAKKHEFFMKKSSQIKQAIIKNATEKNEITPVVKKKQPKLPRKSIMKNDVKKIQLQEAIAEDNKAINRLEKQLKLKNRKKKIPKSFYDDGLGYLLEIIDNSNETSKKEEISSRLHSLKKIGKKERKVSFQDNNEFDDDMDIKSEVENDEEYDDGGGGDESDSCKSDDHENDSGQSESNASGVENNLEDNDNIESVNEDVGDIKDNDKQKKNKSKFWEDIYGRLRDKEGNIVKTESRNLGEKYIPPAKRLSMTTSTKKEKQLEIIRKQLRGLLNRLSEAKMQPISYQIEEIYMKNSRNDVNETLSALLMELIVSPVLMANRLVMEHAMLIALLHGNIGEEIGAHFLQTWICKLEDFLKDNSYEGKMIDNLICFIIHLFTFKITSSILIYDILHKLIESFQEKDIELILLIMKSVGFSLRKDDPSTLKQIILEIQRKATDASLKQDHNRSRVHFMLDTLTAIRNNNMYKIQNYDPDLVEHMRKMLRCYLHKGRSIQELRISYGDLLKADKGGGRWWIVGSAWDDNSDKTDQKQDIENPNEPFNYSENLLQKAKAYKMNTNVRKVIFCTIASSEDYLEAFSKLIRLNLKSMQYREIIVVILDCCLQENPFNLFYVVLADKFCQLERKYRMALQCAVWDKIKYIDELVPSQRNNLADFLLHSFIGETLNITVLKVMSFSDLNVKMMKFLTRIFRKLLLKHSEEQCAKIFSKIPSDQKTFKESLRLFMLMFLDDNKEIVNNRLSLLEESNKML